jgi:hypothetical protein
MPFASHANENLVAKREACRLEARTRIVSKGGMGFDEYRRIVERRNAHVSQCMARVVVARAELPLPLKIRSEASDVSAVSSVRFGKKKAQKISSHGQRRRVKTGSLRTSKGKRLKHFARRHK